MAVESPFPAHIESAQAGALQVRLTPQAFVAIDTACQDLLNELMAAHTAASDLGNKMSWGLGENNARLTSAVELTTLFREKAVGGPNNAVSLLTDYLTIAEDIRALFQAICDTFVRTDADFAATMRGIRV